jgi:hypothetical protein
MDRDMAKSVMGLLTGVLTFSAVIVTIVNNRLQKARKIEHKERIIENCFGVGKIALAVLGGVLMIGFSAIGPALFVFWVLAVLAIIAFLRPQLYPPSRSDIVVLIMCCLLPCLVAIVAFASSVVSALKSH